MAAIGSYTNIKYEIISMRIKLLPKRRRHLKLYLTPLHYLI